MIRGCPFSFDPFSYKMNIFRPITSYPFYQFSVVTYLLDTLQVTIN